MNVFASSHKTLLLLTYDVQAASSMHLLLSSTTSRKLLFCVAWTPYGFLDLCQKLLSLMLNFDNIFLNVGPFWNLLGHMHIYHTFSLLYKFQLDRLITGG